MSQKTCVIYTFAKHNPNVDYFIKMCYEDENIKWIFVQNVDSVDDIYKPNHLQFIEFHSRQNIGYDFGGWSYGLSLINIEDYEYFMFVNSSVRGPLTNEKNWLNIFTSKLNTRDVLVGPTINKHGLYSTDSYT